MYSDLTSRLFVVRAGQAVQPVVNFTGAWMHTYIYIDLNQNGQFDVQTPGPQGQLQEDNELDVTSVPLHPAILAFIS